MNENSQDNFLPMNEKRPRYLVNTLRIGRLRAQTKQLEGKIATHTSELEGTSVLLAELREEEARTQLQVRSLQSSLHESVAQVSSEDTVRAMTLAWLSDRVVATVRRSQ